MNRKSLEDLKNAIMAHDLAEALWEMIQEGEQDGELTPLKDIRGAFIAGAMSAVAILHIHNELGYKATLN